MGDELKPTLNECTNESPPFQCIKYLKSTALIWSSNVFCIRKWHDGRSTSFLTIKNSDRMCVWRGDTRTLKWLQRRRPCTSVEKRTNRNRQPKNDVRYMTTAFFWELRVSLTPTTNFTFTNFLLSFDTTSTHTFTWTYARMAIYCTWFHLPLSLLQI